MWRAPEGLEGQAAVPVGGGGPWPSYKWPADVTNVVNPSPKTAIISEKALRLTTFVTTGQKSTRKTPWSDDVCNNTHPSNISDQAPLVWRAPEGLEGQAAVPVSGGGA